MISRRDNLLIRPWQQRRYDNHRRKVQSAAPAIDSSPPLPRQHVELKLKKKQKEAERCQEIERNNFNLLKRLSYVMRTNRVDNYWTTPQPAFLNRVSMYELKAPKLEEVYVEEVATTPKAVTRRKAKCPACTPQLAETIQIPEERVPWEPQKLAVARFRSKSVPARKALLSEPIRTTKSATSTKVVRSKPKNAKETKEKEFDAKEPQSIVLSRGCLKLSVNFPSDTFVKLQSGSRGKVLLQNTCHCKSLRVC